MDAVVHPTRNGAAPHQPPQLRPATRTLSAPEIIDVARVAHEANRAYCAGLANPAVPVPPAFDDCPQEMRNSILAGVMGFMEHPDRTPEQSHEAWLSYKAAEGWVYGPVKDGEAKTHPCMRPYRELPAEDRRKDHLFRAVVLALIAEV